MLIVVEGIDGAGKSTQVRRIGEALKAAGEDVVLSREPTDGPWGRKLRESQTTGRMSLDEELAAFLEDRREHVRDLIMPALARGAIVILDRYYFSTMAYQGIRGADAAQIRRENEKFAPRPDVVLLVDFDPQTALRRIEQSRGDVPNTFERLDALQAIRAVFLETAAGDPTFRIVDGNGSPDEVFAALWKTLVEGVLRKSRTSKSYSV
ncbi:MAG: dTMP kinase [Pirellula sp.]|nr:dTMP kinase [Pirellula sp.]